LHPGRRRPLLPVVTRSEVRAALEEAGVIPSKRLGQNFLTDANSARWIVEQLEVAPDDCVVEVGPGTGALSEHLAGRVRRLLLVEFDARLAEWLTKRFEGREGVTVVHADAVRFDVRTLFKEQPVKLLGNLPYSAGGAILRNFLRRPSPVSRAVLMLQKEVIDRILAVPRTKDYGVLSLRMQSEWDSAPRKTLGPGLFHPRPAIDSTVMVVEPRRESLPVYDGPLFDELVRRGFAQRRKQLRKALPADPPWPEVAEALGVPETARAEELSLGQWVELTRRYDAHPLRDLPQRGDELFDVVDENDQVVRQERREAVHAENLLHRAVHAFAFNKRGELFLQKRSRLKDVHPGLWDSSAAGHLDAGEDYDACAVRELGEELGVEGAEPVPVARIPACEATGWEFVQLYEVRGVGAVRYPCSEIETGLWLAPGEVEAWTRRRPRDFASGFLACWEAFRGCQRV
jgi:16S rRNA (adenine1518-N6/adenine1519-N6)-dimethyltransferase